MSDILIIGGGVIGLTLARELYKHSAGKITIIERGKFGQEASFAAAGILAPQAESDRDDDFFHFCDESRRLYLKFAEELFSETGVNIELDKSGTLYLAFSEKDDAEIRHRFEWQKTAGLQIEHLSAEKARKVEPFVSPDVREALFFPNDWQVENRKLLAALKIFARINGIETIESTEAKNLLVENGKIVGAESVNKRYLAEKVILATGAWTSLIKAGENVFPVPYVKPIRGQMLSFQTAKRLFSRVIYSSRGYLVPRLNGRILAGATVEDAGFDKTVTKSGIDFLFENALEIAPSLINLSPAEKWVGLRPFAADGLPILGELPSIENLFVATAHYRNGILLAPLTAKILADKIVKNSPSNFLEIFSPRRFAAAKVV